MLKKLKSLFVIEEEDEKVIKKQDDTQKVDQTNNTPPPTTNNPTPDKNTQDDTTDDSADHALPSNFKISLTLDADTDLKKDDAATEVHDTVQNYQSVRRPEHIELILTHLEEHNLPGYDYLEFRHVLKMSESSQKEEATCYNAAITMSKSMGTTGAQLIKDAQHYLDILDQEQQKFDQQAMIDMGETIANKEKLMNETTQSIVDKEAAIEQLKKEIEQAKKEIERTKDSLGDVIIDTKKKKQDFATSVSFIKKQIEQDVSNIRIYDV